jgi:hypothetical protein
VPKAKQVSSFGAKLSIVTSFVRHTGTVGGFKTAEEYLAVYPSGRLGEAIKGLRGNDELAERHQQQKAERGHDSRRSGAVRAIVGGGTAEALYYAGENAERIQDAVRNIRSREC